MARATWIAFLALVVVSTIVRAEEDEALDRASADEPSEQEAAQDGADGKDTGITGIQARALFLSHDGNDLKVHAGEKVNALLGFANSASNQPMNVIFATAHLLYAGSAVSTQNDGANYVMNFSGTMYNHVVQPGESGTFNYAFTTDEQIDPRAYDLVIKVYFSTDNNASYVATAYQGTVLVEDPLSFDFKTYGTLLAIVAAAGYAGYRYSAKRTRGRAPVARNLVETKSGVTYDADFVSPDHLRYVQSQSPKTKSTSPSKRTASK